ncbi:MAG TPA: imidazolonepropionase [Candidatus Limnocylindria bacterium]|nr:imidazolonepropionase [Candidatus Limnocylindria bacterium]
MTEADLVIRRARVLTLAPLKEERPRTGPAAGDVGAIDDGWVAARDGVVVATGRGEAWQQLDRVPNAIEVDAEGRVVMPGFVDAHTHLCYAGQRWEEFVTRRSGADYLAVLAGGGGIHATVRATRDASDEELAALLRRRIARAVGLGTTTLEIKSGYGLEPAQELRQLRVIASVAKQTRIDVAVTYLALHALPAARADDRRGFVREAAGTVATVASEGLAEAVDAFVEKGVFEIDDVRPLAKAAREAGLALSLHADQLNDVGATAYAARAHARSADHVANASADGLRALARAAIPAVLLPGSAFFVGYAPPDARRFVAADVPVVVATDHNPGTSPLEGLPTAIALGVVLCGLTPHQAIVAATINAAHALGRGERTGALIKGRRADIAILDTDDERELAYRLGGPLVREVYAAGRKIA